MQRIVSPQHAAAALTAPWSPRVIAEVDDYYLKVARVEGRFGWHSHEHEDELFLVLAGQLCIEMRAGTVTLGAGELFVVPKGILHNPSANGACLLMLLERKSTLHAGSQGNPRACSLAEQLQPIRASPVEAGDLPPQSSAHTGSPDGFDTASTAGDAGCTALPSTESP